MSSELKFPASVTSDEARKDIAFAQYRIEHGISDDRRLGDMPLQVISAVLLAAQRLKTQEASQ
jgi:hypothetical protein